MKTNLLLAVVVGLVFAGAGRSLAHVTITAARSVTNSADWAQNGAAPQWTTLSNIVISEPGNSKGDIAVQTNETLILTAPAGWRFNAAVGTLIKKQNNTDMPAATMSVSDSTITVTITVTNVLEIDTLTISNIQAQATEGGNLPAAGGILRTSANPGTAAITGINNNVTSFGFLSQTIGDRRLYLALPGQTFTDAATVAASGISGSPAEQAVGVAFDIASLVVADRQYNIDSSYGGVTNISYSGPGIGTTLNPSYTTNVSFTSGTSTTTLATTLGKAETVALTATDGTITGVASSNLTVNKGDQVITFEALADKTYGDAPFEVDATASSELPVNLSILSGPATVLEDMVTITGIGDVTVQASQAGDDDWNGTTPVDRSFNVATRILTVSATGINKVYDGTTNATVNLSDNRVVGDDLTINYTPASFADANVDAGKPVSVTGITVTGPDSVNYTHNTTASTTADITALDITGDFWADNKIYDGTTNATVLTRTLIGVLAGDLGNVSLTGGTAGFADANVGVGKTVTLTGAGLVGPAAGNYNLTSVDTALADITALDITGDFTAADKIYDGTNSATVLTRTLIGVLTGDLGNVSLDGGTAAFADANAGVGKTVTLTGASLGGSAAGNYNLTSVDTATANIAQFPATVILDNLGQIYDGTARSATASTIPSGLTVNVTYNGSASAPTNAGTYQVIGTVSDANHLGGATNNLVVSLAVSPASLPNVIRNTTYANLATIVAAGGVAPYTFGVGAGFPAGLTLNATNGLIKGKPANLGAYAFAVTVTDMNGSTGAQAYKMLVTAAGDVTTAPSVTIKFPANANNGTVSGSTVVVTGIMSDASGVTNLQVSVNNGPYGTATLYGLPTSGTWSYDAGPLPAGLNNVKAIATDLLGNTSAPKYAQSSNTFFYSVQQTLTIVTNGAGAVGHSGATTYGTVSGGASLIVGRPYAIKVTAANTHLFSNIWNSANGNSYVSTTYPFTMSSGLTLRVTFSTNRFFAVAGSYVGLITNPGGIAFSNSGYFSAKVTAKTNKLATVSGRLQVEGNRKPFKKMTFDLFGISSEGTVDRSKWSKPNLTVRLVLSLDGSDTLSGTVSNNEVGGWVSDISAYREVATNMYAGRYTMSLSCTPTNYVNEPGGYGWGTVTVDTNGVVKVTGALADLDILSQKTRLSPTGQWPLFSWGASAGNGQYNSMIMGWLNVNSSNGITGNPVWIKQSGGKRYTGGFALQPEVIGSPYGTNPLVTWTGNLGVLSIGWDFDALTNDYTRSVQLTNDIAFVIANRTNAATLKLIPKTGKLSLKFQPSEFSNGNTPGSGVILTNLNGGRGFFTPSTGSGVNANYSGAFELVP